jgi:hypothetical protein
VLAARSVQPSEQFGQGWADVEERAHVPPSVGAPERLAQRCGRLGTSIGAQVAEGLRHQDLDGAAGAADVRGARSRSSAAIARPSRRPSA